MTGLAHARSSGDGVAHANRLCDINKERIAEMDKHNVEISILSLTAPGIQECVASVHTALTLQLHRPEGGRPEGPRVQRLGLRAGPRLAASAR